ncbi:MAG: NADH:flavin oxidoreductase, partial [Synergistaceae bacterium]|nr:NADH:flavin oxidoreductase [Synergistaceae bacterium]
MALYEPFKFAALDELRQKVESLGLEVAFSDNLQTLSQEAPIGGRRAPNRFSTLPMEGRDSQPDGSPSDLTFRRYRRYGSGGWGLIQFEACAVWPGGRSSDRQLAIGPSTEKALASLLEATKEAAREALGPSHSPLCLLQLQDA